jgi:hypothetical protein
MRIAAITKFKQGDIWEALRQLGWSVSKLADKSGLSKHLVYNTVNLTHAPTKRTAEAIQGALGEAGIYIDIEALFPETFKPLPKKFGVEQIRDVEPESLTDHREALQIADSPSVYDIPMVEDVMKIVGELGDSRFVDIADGIMEGRTQKEDADKFHVCPQTIRALRGKLCHHIRRKLGTQALKELADDIRKTTAKYRNRNNQFQHYVTP